MNKKVGLLFDYHLLLFQYMVRKYEMNIHDDRNKETDEIVNFLTNTFSHISGAINLEAIKFIEIMQQRLEQQMKNKISTKSIFYWFHLYRRIAPIASFDNESKQTVQLYRNILESAFLKYGRTQIGDEIIYSTKKRTVKLQDIASGLHAEAISIQGFKTKYLFQGFFLGKFGEKDLLDIFSLERLAYEFWHTTVCLRRIYKGGILYVEIGRYWVENNSDTEFLMHSYDSRGYFDDLSCSDGINLFAVKDLSSNITLLPKYNVEQISLQEYPQHEIFNVNIIDDELKNFTPNFLWIPLDFDNYFKNHEFYMAAFQNEFGYRLESFVYTIYLILFREYMKCRDNKIGIDNLKRAYRHIENKEYLSEDLFNFYRIGKDCGKYTFWISKEEIQKVLDDLTLPRDTSNISLITLGPRYLLLPILKKDYIIDYSAILPILLTKMHFLKVKEEKKGHLFEDTVINQLKKRGINIWECKKKLEHKDGTSKEIDISFIYKGFLFIGELKSTKMSLNFIKGDFKSLEFRKAKIIDALQEVDDKANWLRLHTNGTNYCILKDVKAIVPFVVTPFTEYLWSRDDNLWLTDLIPRVCTPTECVTLCKDEIIKSLVDKPFVKILS